MTDSFVDGGDTTKESVDAKVSDETKVETSKQLSDVDVGELVKRDLHAQGHITKLESETANMRDEISKLKDAASEQVTAAEVLKQLSDEEKVDNKLDVGDAIKAEFDRREAKTYEDKELVRKEENFKKVTETLKGEHGDKVDDYIKEVCNKNAISFDQALKMAHDMPDIFLKLCGQETKPTQSAPSEGSINTSGFQANTNTEPERLTMDKIMSRTSKEAMTSFEERLTAKVNQLNS